MRSHDSQPGGRRQPLTGSRHPTSANRLSIAVALWLFVVFIGYALTLGAEILSGIAGPSHAPAVPVDLLLPAYAVMIVAVVLGLMRSKGPSAAGIAAETGRTDRGGPSHGR